MIGLDSRAKHVFTEALDLSSDERAVYLARACAGDGALRARVEQLLASAEVQDEFLAEPSGPGAAALDAQREAMTDALSSEAAGTRIGPFLLLELIGEGGFGSVFLAQQERPVQRRVALKVIKLGMDTRAVVARFEQERQALAVMDHPNIAKVLDAGVTGAGRPYFVMEYVRGLPITKYCDGRKLSVRDRIELFTQVCGAVQHAHGRGIIHRDIKPSNILVGEVDGKPSVKVIDFGIAKAMDRRLTESTIYTEQRALVGTPEYMSPEQAEGLLDLDTRTDVYSLGVVLYELLVGTPPFDGRQLYVGPRAEMERILKEVEPARPSTRITEEGTADSVAAQRGTRAQELCTQLKGELDWIVMHALEKDRLRRYDSAAGLAADLGRFLRGEAVLAAPPSRVYLARKFVRRHRVGVITGAIVFAALATGTVGTSVGMFRAREAEAIAAAQAARARRSAAAAASVNELMTGMVRRADRGNEGGRTDVSVREVMDIAARDLLANTSRQEPEVVARLAETIGATYKELSQFDKAEPMMRLAAETWRSLEGEGSVAYAEALSHLGAVLYNQGKSDAAMAVYEQAERIARNAGDAGVMTFAAVMNNRATIARDEGRMDEAASLLVQGRTLIEQQGQQSSEVYATTLQNTAAVLFSKGDLDGAEAAFKECLRVRTQLGMDADSRLMILQNYGALQWSRGKLEEAKATLTEQVALSRELYGPSIRLAEAIKSLAVVYSATGDTGEAVRLHRQSIEIASPFLPADSSTLAFMMADLGSAMVTDKQWDDAVVQFRKALPILLREVGIGHTEVVMSHYRLAVSLENLGKLDEAELELRKVLNAEAEGMKPGARYEWMKSAVRSGLGGVRLKLGSVPDAKELIPAAAEELLRLAPKMGVKTRLWVCGAALDRCVDLYESMDKGEPGGGHAAKAAEWRARREEFLAAASSAAKK